MAHGRLSFCLPLVSGGIAETCQRPWWDPRLRLAPDQEEYKENEEVALSCPEGFQPPFTHIRCAGGVQALEYSGFADRTTWMGRKSTGVWIHTEGPVLCLGTWGGRNYLLCSPVIQS
ncbi:Receptor-type tyrosine-protein phosphatase epsilon-like protein [Aix galericulata]|nr:Receptor-type tyrosine-protein phosphatase epsilon-like protein [Aix galericulata]